MHLFTPQELSLLITLGMYTRARIEELAMLKKVDLDFWLAHKTTDAVHWALPNVLIGCKATCQARTFKGKQMNLILEKTDQVSYFTDMRRVFEAANISLQDYDWYVSDIETNWTPPGFSPVDQWFTGEALASFLREHEVQFIWAVFSAVPKGFRSNPSSAPYVQGNPSYWSGEKTSPQLEGALFEIACWDSSGTILINLPAQAARSFLTKFADTRPLATARN